MPSPKVIIGHLHSEDDRQESALESREKIQRRSTGEELNAEADVLEFIKGILVFILIVAAAATLGYYLNKYTS
ncbi:hypothetical protein [Sphingobacterium corticibacter]|uniref:Uncharacterized protein n=1 Tax=Sphingobacterium corticibacter TaxID=2171749 RepID=A0A2T8HNV2_9SPHI|nr:hypothetical protein [Sphingobacterium corticibacter]PVH26982.1 hypothetical protein DC487_05145 [Sphingobacterium corticibacter]